MRVDRVHRIEPNAVPRRLSIADRVSAGQRAEFEPRALITIPNSFVPPIGMQAVHEAEDVTSDARHLL
jgi:hypothetical protein